MQKKINHKKKNKQKKTPKTEKKKKPTGEFFHVFVMSLS